MKLIHLKAIRNEQTCNFPLLVLDPGDRRFIDEICSLKNYAPAVYAIGGRGAPDMSKEQAGTFWRAIEPTLLNLWAEGRFDEVQPGGIFILHVFDKAGEP